MLDTTMAYGLTYLFPATDNAVGQSLRNHGEFARPEADLIRHYVNRKGQGATFLDVGANIGAICLPVAAQCPGATVIALEAQRRVHAILAANVLNNRLFNVECHHMAAGSRNGTMDFPSVPLTVTRNFGDVGVDVADAQQVLESVQVRKLDDLPIQNLAFIKIDVQGAEIEVLRGASELIARERPPMLLEVTRQKTEETLKVAEFMQNAGYSLYVFFSPFNTPSAAKPSNEAASFRGDYSFLALPSADMNDWGLAPFESLDTWPGDLVHHRYLRNYGY